MNMPLIAAAAMAGGALLGFSLCWAATRLAGGNHAAAARLATAAKKKMGTMDKVLILEGVILVAYTAADLGFENGVMGWIKTTKEKVRDRRWEQEDRERMRKEEQEAQNNG